MKYWDDNKNLNVKFYYFINMSWLGCKPSVTSPFDLRTTVLKPRLLCFLSCGDFIIIFSYIIIFYLYYYFQISINAENDHCFVSVEIFSINAGALSENIAFPESSLLQNKSHLVFRQLNAVYVKLQQWKMFGLHLNYHLHFTFNVTRVRTVDWQDDCEGFVAEAKKSKSAYLAIFQL